MMEEIKLKAKRGENMNVRQLKTCEYCGEEYMGTLVQRCCSDPCRKQRQNGQMAKFKAANPTAFRKYNQTRKEKNPTVWRDKWSNGRDKILEALGGKCIVCGVENPNWLHIDYAPTIKGTGKRHPRHPRWVFDHLDQFRILCANHHYELTITGKIEGTDITQ